MSRAFPIVAVLLVASACHRGPRTPRFAVDVPNSPRVVVREDFGADSQVERASLEALPPPAAPAAGWESLLLHYVAEGDGVRVTVYTMHQEYDPRRHSTIFRSQKRATHAARAGSAVTLSELEKLGYKAFALRVVAAR